MSEPPLKTFIPAWLDDAGLSLAEFRTYCNLVRRRGEDGIAWPSYEAMAKTCGLGRATVWRALKSLEDRGFIEKLGKGFGQSTRYRIPVAPNSSTTGTNEAPPMVSPQERLKNSFTAGTVGDLSVSPEERLGSNSFTAGTNASPPIVSQGNSNSSSDDTPIVSPEEREGNPKKVIQQKEETHSACERELADIAIRIVSNYPRQEKVAVAQKIVRAHLKDGEDPEAMLAGTKAIAAVIALAPSGARNRFVPGAEAFFRDMRWMDDPEVFLRNISPPGGRGDPQAISEEAVREALAGRDDSETVTVAPSADYIVRCYPKKGAFAECLEIVNDHIAAGEDPSAMMEGVSLVNRRNEPPSSIMSPLKFFREKHWKTTPQADVPAPDVEAAMGKWA